jgi:hypothetical protein
MKVPETPFPRHWRYYIALKIAVIVAALIIAAFLYARYWT